MSQSSSTAVLAAVQLQLYCAQARVAWSRVEELEAERKTTEKRLRDVKHERIWAITPIQRKRIDNEMRSLDEVLSTLAPQLHRATDAALLASERATSYGWGIKLGRRYRITREGLTTLVLVQSLRPLPCAEGKARMLVSGLVDNRPTMFVLGRDVLTIEPLDEDKVIDITARLYARGAKPR